MYLIHAHRHTLLQISNERERERDRSSSSLTRIYARIKTHLHTLYTRGRNVPRGPVHKKLFGARPAPPRNSLIDTKCKSR